jgi:hypothetical protein
MLRCWSFGFVLFAVGALAACGGHGGAVLPSGFEHPAQKSFAPLIQPLTASPSPSPLLYVANQKANSVTIYKMTASGDAAPLAKISGGNTSLQAPSSLGLEADRRLYVLNASSIAVFAAGAKGNVKPTYLVSGGLTQLNSPQGIAVEASGKVFVTNQSSGGGYITAYAPGSNGDEPPVQTIYGDTSLLFFPSGIAFHGSLLYVADLGDQTINEYSASANGNVSPTNVIDGLNAPTGVAVDSSGLIYVTDGNAIIVYAANATGFATPLRTISGSATQLDAPAGLTVFSSLIWVADSSASKVTEYHQAAKGDSAPVRVIYGAATALDYPLSVAVH